LDVFISYAMADKLTADAACAALEASGIRCWIAPRDVAPGMDYAEAVIDAIENCRGTLLIFSSSANRSNQVKREIERAVQHGIPIIPFRIEDVPPSRALEFFIDAPRWLDALTPPLEQHLKRLAVTMRVLLNRTSAEPADHPIRPGTDARIFAATSNAAGASRSSRRLIWILLFGGLAFVLLAGLCFGGLLLLWSGPSPSRTSISRELSTVTPVSSAIAQGTLSAQPRMSSGPQPGASTKPEVRTLLNEASQAEKQGDNQKALAMYNEALQLDPDSADLYNARGIIYSDRGEYDKAIADYTEAIRLFPKHVAAFTNRGNAYERKRLYQAALADFNAAIGFDSKYFSAYNGRGIIYDDEHQYEKAITDYSQAIRLNPNYANAYNNRGNALSNLRRYEEALNDYNEALRLYPEYVYACNGRGVAYYDKGDYDRAIADYTHAISLNPNYALAYKNRGLAYEKTGAKEKSKADLATAHRLDPSQ
jgi:Flp pilus assembly protein TadD